MIPISRHWGHRTVSARAERPFQDGAQIMKEEPSEEAERQQAEELGEA